jgi:predicted ArsR family transcriptional regulator
MDEREGIAVPDVSSTPRPLSGPDHGTRARVARLILEKGPITASSLGERLGLTPAAIRRHLDHLTSEGMVEARDARPTR